MLEQYKPLNVHKQIKLYGSRATEVCKPMTEEEFRVKIRESSNRVKTKEKGM